MLEDYMVVDLEMTGLRAKVDRILEIGAVRVEQGNTVAVFGQIINPRMEVPEQITELTGITNEMAREGCSVGKAVEEFRKFADGLPLIGHNILFDYSFLKQYVVNQGGTFEKDGIDTLKLSRKFLPEAEKKTLDYLCSYLNIAPSQRHRALEDAKATAALFQYLQRRFEAEEPEDFLPKPLQYKVKRQGPATTRQKKYLKELTDWHKIDLDIEIDSLTRNEASRLTDKILSAYGKVPRSHFV